MGAIMRFINCVLPYCIIRDDRSCTFCQYSVSGEVLSNLLPNGKLKRTPPKKPSESKNLDLFGGVQ